MLKLSPLVEGLMKSEGGEESVVLRDLGGGLILRRATIEDTEALKDFNAQIHREPDVEGSSEAIAESVKDLMGGDHPTCGVSDFTLVEDRGTGKIVSSMVLIPQTWSYGGIEFGVGRSELVGTHPDYRRRGLVRAQYEVIHEWSASRGHKIQAITGIPGFYRQFGYEMCLTLGGGRTGYLPHVPELKEGEQEAYHIRRAQETDIPFIAKVDRQAGKRYLVTCVRDETLWRYELSGRSEKSINRIVINVIETRGGTPVGYLGHPDRLRRFVIVATMYELASGVSWLAVTPSVVRYLKAVGEVYAERKSEGSLKAFTFDLGAIHPVYEVIQDRLPRWQEPYAWYIRVPDLPGFLQHVAPVLERRLAESVAAGHTGELRISFYREGFKLTFDTGKLTDVEHWCPSTSEDGDAVFPALTFLQLLFGYRSLKAMTDAFADCGTRGEEARVLLKALFPGQPSNVWPIS
jgi:predicted N-acetyltransferase YhbS